MKTRINEPEVPSAAALGEALGSTTRTGSRALKDAVCAFVDEAKVLGWPIEQIIVGMKRIASVDAGLGEIRLTNAPASQSESGRVVDQAISWAIAHYYGERPR